MDCSPGCASITTTSGIVSRSHYLPFSIFGRRRWSGAVTLMSSCCRLYDKRSTKDRMCLALSGYLSLMQTGWNFFSSSSRELCCHVSDAVMSLRMCNFYVYLHSTQGVDDSLDVTYECRSVALSPSPTFVCTYMCLNTDVTVTARILSNVFTLQRPLFPWPPTTQ